jgi:hypothetical protein
MDRPVSDRPTSEGQALERARNLFRFLKAFAERNVPVHRSLQQHAWTLALRDLPSHPSVSLGEALAADPDANAPDEEIAPLLRVARPRLTRAPEPPAILREHLEPGWDRADGAIHVRPARNVVRAGETVTERFEDDSARETALEEWRARWNSWAQAERPALAAMRLFERLYELHGRIERESEQVELMVGDGRLRWIPREQAAVDHPLLLQRVELHFDPDAPAFVVMDSERAPELYGALIADSGLSPAKLNELRTELERGGYHPLAGEATSGYLRRLVQLLGRTAPFTRAGRRPWDRTPPSAATPSFCCAPAPPATPPPLTACCRTWSSGSRSRSRSPGWWGSSRPGRRRWWSTPPPPGASRRTCC